ncbi:Uncharacterised protein [Mycobacteroides abscessus subsp. abscessus]|nr:Uncharacterised protein [Mycobacteroides abscessus subsp. abscessus]
MSTDFCVSRTRSTRRGDGESPRRISLPPETVCVAARRKPARAHTKGTPNRQIRLAPRLSGCSSGPEPLRASGSSAVTRALSQHRAVTCVRTHYYSAATITRRAAISEMLPR